MKLSSKEWFIIFIESLIAISLLLLSLGKINLSSLVGLILLILIVVIILVFVFGIVYKRIGEIDKALDIQETKQKQLEITFDERLKISNELINLKSDIKNIYWILEHGKKS